MSYWRDQSRKVIERARAEGIAQGLAGRDLEKFVRAAYPFGERAMWPYKVWCSEFKRQMRPAIDNRTAQEKQRAAESDQDRPLFKEEPTQ